jgi:predicted nucleic acid-binding protein
MTSKVFIDTNILIYALDKHDTGKQSRCRQLLKSLADNGIGVISTQVIQEFYVTITKKLGIDPLTAKEILVSFERFEIVITTLRMINEAIDCSIINRLSFWDALIISAAHEAKCNTVLTEDLNHGQIIRGATIVNPFT